MFIIVKVNWNPECDMIPLCKGSLEDCKVALSALADNLYPVHTIDSMSFKDFNYAREFVILPLIER